MARRSASRPDAIAAGPFQVNFARRVVTAEGGPIHLSRREFDLLALLLSPPGRVRTRDELIDKLWSGRDLADTRTLDTHIRRLRLKLEDDPAHPQFLLTVRGVGFRFELGVHEQSPPVTPSGAALTSEERCQCDMAVVSEFKAVWRVFHSGLVVRGRQSSS